MVWRIERNCKKNCIHFATCTEKKKGKSWKAEECEKFEIYRPSPPNCGSNVHTPRITNITPMPPVKPPRTKTNREWLEGLNDEEYSHFVVATLKNEWAISTSKLTYEEYLERWLKAKHKD